MTTKTAVITKWSIDPAHSEILFKVKHLVITTVTGRFKEVSGTVTTEGEDFNDSKIEFNAEVNSVDTNVEARNTHLKSPDFFDATNFPLLTFTTTEMIKKSEENYLLKGNLTIRNITKPVELDVEYFGTHKDPFYGTVKAGFEINGKVRRKEFGLKWDVLTEAGGAVVGDEVKIHCNIELVRE
jgi:polyisoprenoid-binding protein YceI